MFKKGIYFSVRITIVLFVFILISCGDKKEENISRKESCNVFVSKFNLVGNTILLKCRLNDSITGNFFFDTGAYQFSLDSSFNRAIINKYSKFKIQHNDSGNVYYEGLVRKKISLKIGAISLHTFPLDENLDMKKFGGKLMDGIIGIEPFMNRSISINFDDSTFSESLCDNIDEKVKYTLNPIKQQDGFLIIEATVDIGNGIKITGSFLFDTGCGPAIFLTNETRLKYELDTIVKKLELIGNNLTLYGKTNQFIIKGKNIKIFNKNLLGPRIVCSRDTGAPFGHQKYIGVIGSEIFNKFNYVINVKRTIVYSVPNKSFNAKFKPIIGLGFCLVDRTDICDGYVVSGIIANADAYTKGIRNNDIITHLNGNSVKNLSEIEMKTLFSKISNKVLITILRNKEKMKFEITPRELL